MKPSAEFTGQARVLIGTPTATGDVSARYMVSVFALLAALKQRGVDAEVLTHRGGWVALARNILAGHAVAQGYSHLWFIDADESFETSEALRVWDAMEHGRRQGEWSRQVVGAFYPSKIVDWSRASQNLAAMRIGTSGSKGTEADELRREVSRGSWVRQELGPVGSDNVVEVDWLPTGFLLIATDALREMRERTPSLAYFDRRYGASHAWFTNALLPTYGDILAGEKLTGTDYCGEDVTFSRLWRKLGGKLWEVKGVEIRHEGRMVF